MTRKSILKRLLSGQRGVTLVEMIVATMILGTVGVGLLAALSTGLLAGIRIEDGTSAANLATSQLEDSLSRNYSEPPEYPLLTPPDGYSLSSDNYVVDPTLLQLLTIAVSNSDRTLLEIATGKLNNSYVASPPSLLLAQRDFQWYANTNGTMPVTSMAEENSAYTIRDLSQVYRLRLSVQVGRLPLSAGEQAFKLQYSTSTSGPWTDVGATGSGEIWRGYNNATPADGAALSSLLLSDSDVLESYEEANSSVANPNAVAIGEWAEWDWVVQENGAPYNTNFYFRMVKADGTAFGSYTRYPIIAMPPPLTLTQFDYRWYANADSVNPVTPLASEHASYTSTVHGISYRLRMNVGVDGINLQPGVQDFKLQYSTGTSGPWTDVGAAGSAEIWRGYDNTTPADGATITSLLLSTSHVMQSYEEANPSVTNPGLISVSQRGEWDWVIEDNGAADSTAYYFRMVKSDGTVLDSYTYFPQVTTPAAQTMTQQDYRWYQNADSIVLTTALAAENNTYAGATQPSAYRLRMNVEVNGADLLAGIQGFKLQYAAGTGGPWTDVGDIGSAEIWRGYNNTTPADGTALTGLLLSTSNVLESYEESNASVTNPNGINIGQLGEWDWVIQDNGATGGATYYFRMVKSDGTVLDTYTRYPGITTAAQTMTQQDYRWYENANNITPVSALALENTAYTSDAHDLIYRIRMNIGIDNVWLPAGAQIFKLQYSTGTGGPWTDVGAAGSAEIWRGYDNTIPADGATLSSLLLTSNVLESYEEANPSAANPTAINVGERGEWDWAIEDNGAAASTAYYFRMVKSDGTALDAYTRYPQVTIPAPLTLTLQDYRWYQNTDSITPATALAAENTGYNGAEPLVIYRLRLNIAADGANLAAGTQAFKMQYSTNQVDWTDVGAIGSAEIWRGYDNATPADGATLTSLLSTSDVNESYEEANPSVSNPGTINVGQQGEWDWVIQNSGASGNTTYYFRMVKDDGGVLYDYSSYPQITTSVLTFTQQDYVWYENTDGTTPTAALAGTNTAYSSSTYRMVYRLRLNVEIGGLDLPATAQSFKLQYSTNQVDWTDVGAIGSAEIWRGYDNGTPADGASLSSLLLTSDVLESYEEANPSAANPNAINIGQRGEWDWAVQDNGAAVSTAYYFRMVKSDGTALDTYSINYPRVTTPAALTLTQQDYRWYQNTDGITPITALAPENMAYSGAIPLGVYRLRLNMGAGGANLAAGTLSFKMQYSTNQVDWTDVGAIGSAEIWRGYDNATPADGATLTSLLSTSDVNESYEEANPSVSNPGTINIGQQGEWDWVIQNNGASGITSYYFRMVKDDGTALDTYSYSQIITAALTFTQQDYRWYENINSLTPTTSLAAENTDYIATAHSQVYRIRMNVQVDGSNLPASAQSFKLQYSTNQVDWTDVGAIGSTDIWRGYDNVTPADGATLSSLLLASNVLESYEEANPSAANPGAINIGQRGEWDWVVENNDATVSTAYYFRMVRSNGTALNNYTRYPQVTTAAVQTLTQQEYRWYENRNSSDPVTSLAAENTSYTATVHGLVYRLRLNVAIDGADLAAGSQSFKLQYSSSTSGPWADVGANGSAELWRGYDNATPADGEMVAVALLLSNSDVRGTYEESNPSVTNPNAINIGQWGEWDWVVEDNNAAAGTVYYFRVVKSDGTALDAYTRYPLITTAPPITFTQQDYRWYQNLDSITPDTSLAAENTAFPSATAGGVYRLRMNVEVGGVDLLAATQSFKLQYSTGTGGPWTDVGALGSVDIWRGYDNSTPSDGSTVAVGLLLSASNVRESYEESNPSVANPNALAIGQRGEWDWVVQNNYASPDTIYYFRMVRSDGTTLNTYGYYPQLTTVPAPIAWDNFESGGLSGGAGWINAWNTSGDASISPAGESYEGSYSLRMRRDTGYASRSVDLSGRTNARLQFWAKAQSWNAGDTASVLVSSNGTDWTVVQTWVYGDADNVYHFFDIDLSSYSLTSTFWIAFDVNMSSPSNYLYVDDINIVG